jgi:hypothetical protein
MSKFEWMELETLNGEIAHSQKRLDAARSVQDHRLVRLLQQEITETTERRDRLLSQITVGLDASTAPTMRRDRHSTRRERAKPEKIEESSTEPAADIAATDTAASEPAPVADTMEGVAAVWDRLTTADIERAKRGLAGRRFEMLARHAEELKALEAEQAEIDTVERAIDAFARKFKTVSGAEVVPFETERSAQTQGG